MGAQRYEFAIVGAGASGLMAAGETVQAGSTIVLEAKQKPGKKLLATGNGRCNLGNRGVSPTHYHGDVERASRVLERFSPEKLEQFWRKNGLLCRELDEGRLYPYGMQAASVLACWNVCCAVLWSGAGRCAVIFRWKRSGGSRAF